MPPKNYISICGQFVQIGSKVRCFKDYKVNKQKYNRGGDSIFCGGKIYTICEIDEARDFVGYRIVDERNVAVHFVQYKDGSFANVHHNFGKFFIHLNTERKLKLLKLADLFNI